MTAFCDGGIHIEVCVVMTLERKIARAFAMSDEVWALHTNPWSVWTRFTVLPLLVLAIWTYACLWRRPPAVAVLPTVARMCGNQLFSEP